MLKVRNLRRDENGAIHFSIAYKGEFDDEIEVTNYRTNNECEGLFYDLQDWRYKQLWGYGPCQFQLKQKTLSGVRKAIYREFGGGER